MKPKLDYFNYLFHGCPMYMLERIQKVQSSAARLIYQCRKQNHISSILISLHWLLINTRIKYTLTVICHSFLLGQFAIYLSDPLSVYTPKRNLRSCFDNGILCILNCEQRHLGIAHFLLQPPQYGIHCLQNSDILFLSRNLSQH